MAGMIAGFYGFQRSGKTLLAYLIAESLKSKYGIKVYTNMNVKGYKKIYSLNEIPLDYKPKILLLDEAYYFMDSRNWKNNTDTTIFFNTIGKQNILMLLTAISPDMIEKRLREQHNYMFIAKSNEIYISYKIVDIQRNKKSELNIKKSKEIFKKVKYDSMQVPDMVDCSIEQFNKKIREKNKKR